MIARRVALAFLPVIPLLLAAEPTPVEKHLALQKAMATARQYLDVNMPADAVATLEAEVANADGNKAFLALLRESYLAELYRLEKADAPDAAKVAQVRRNISLLGGTAAPAHVAPPTPAPASMESMLPPPALDVAPTADAGAEAAAAFKRADYAEAAKLFATLPAPTADQKLAWAYCRIKLAADRLNAPACTATVAAMTAKDVAEALQLAPQHAELQKVGQVILATARQKEGQGGTGADFVETASFRVRHGGNRDLAESIAQAAESQRKAIFERWSGPPATAWGPKCEIVIHPTAEAFAKATNRAPQSTGNALVRLANGRPTERRIDLRADDAGMVSNALPRELAHVVLVDLFPDSPAPKWAVEGIAILSGTAEEAGRYTRTLPRCAREGDWHPLAQLMEMKDFPAEKITGFYCESVSLTEYLVRAAGGERNFTIFLRDCRRYGTAAAIKRTYGVAGPEALEENWRRAALETSRGQAP